MVEEVESEGMPLDHSPSVGLDATDPNANEFKQERNDQVQSTGCSPDDFTGDQGGSPAVAEEAFAHKNTNNTSSAGVSCTAEKRATESSDSNDISIEISAPISIPISSL